MRLGRIVPGELGTFLFSFLHYEYMHNIINPNTVVHNCIIHIRIPHVRVLTPFQYSLEPSSLYPGHTNPEAYSPTPVPTQVLFLFYRF